MNDMSAIPKPYPRNTPMYPDSPWSKRCDEIDEAAKLDVKSFITVARAEEQLDPNTMPAVFFSKPNKKYREEGGCPFYGGHLNGGSVFTSICTAANTQMHGYVETKLCEGRRQIHCPVYKAGLVVECK